MDDSGGIEGLGERMARFGSGPAEDGEDAAAKRVFAAAVREVLEELDRAAIPASRFEEEAGKLRALAEELRESGVSHPPGASPGYTGMENFYDRSPIVGQANPVAPPAVLEHYPEQQCVRGRVEFGNPACPCRWTHSSSLVRSPALSVTRESN